MERSGAGLGTPGASTSQAPFGRRNRNALRDFYNLQSGPVVPATDAMGQESSTASGANAESGPSEGGVVSEEAELDRADFEPQPYVLGLLEQARLGDVLSTESRLLSEIRGLDGEKKALVYDNYSKLIRATDTIGHMRGEMDKEGVGLEGVGARLNTLVADIVQRAGSVASDLPQDQAVQSDSIRMRQRNHVQWLLQAPERMRGMLREGREQDALREWKAVQARLEYWQNADGVADICSECERILPSIKRT